MDGKGGAGLADDICIILMGDTDLKGDGRGTCLGVALVEYGIGVGLEDHGATPSS